MRISLLTCRKNRRTGASRRATWWAMTAAAMLLASTPAMAEHMRWWRQNSYEDLNKGTARGVALRSDGKLFLAPRFAEFADANLAYLLALRADSKGNLYAAGGSNAKVLRLGANGGTSTVFESSELAAQALAIDPADNLYVGTSPDGKVYKVTPDGKSSVFFDPKTKYIWGLAMDRDRTLYVATGDTGKIFAVAPDGKGQVFYSSEESHIRALAINSNGDVLAGTEPSGLVLRIPKTASSPVGGKARPASVESGSNPNTRRAFVLYETSQQEITALQLDAKGNLYVAAVGEKTPPAPGVPRQQTPAVVSGGSFTITVGAGENPQQVPGQVQPTPFVRFPTVTSSAVYRIAPDGSPEELWTSRRDLVYTLGFLPNGKLLLGTGNQGAVLELDANKMFSRVVTTTSEQVTSVATGPGGKLYLATANPGKVFTLGPDNEPEGSFESQPFDAEIFSRWGRLQWMGQPDTPAGNTRGARIEFYARSGNTSNPGDTWSPWAGPYSDPGGDRVECPPARFVQWRAVLHGAAAAPVPELDWVSVAYLPKNVAPEITAIAVQDPGIRVQGISISQPGGTLQTPVQLRMPQPAPSASSSGGVIITNAASSTVASRFESMPQGFRQKGYLAVLWTADDQNDDDLEYAIYFRREDDPNWKLMKDKIHTQFYSWDSTTMADGAYYLKIVTSDAPSNPEGKGLTAERVSDRFVVDNTPPTITQLTASTIGDPRNASAVRVQFQASDPVSPVSRAQYSLDAGDWALVFPVGGLSDSLHESYDFRLEKVGPGEHTVTVRVFDQFDNVSTTETKVQLPVTGN
jgi:hypothetical protein